MAFSDFTEYPRGVKRVTSLSNTAKELFPTTNRAKISHIVLTPGTAKVTVIFRALDDSPEVIRVSLLADETQVIPGWKVDAEGLEVITAAGDGNTEVTAFYLA